MRDQRSSRWWRWLALGQVLLPFAGCGTASRAVIVAPAAVVPAATIAGGVATAQPDASSAAPLARRPSEPRTMTYEQALDWLHSLDPDALRGQTVARPLDFTTLNITNSRVTLYGSGIDEGCSPIDLRKVDGKLEGKIVHSRKTRPNGDIEIEGEGIELGGEASWLGTENTVIHHGVETEGEAMGDLRLLGVLADVQRDRIVYAACQYTVMAVTCADPHEVVHDRCAGGPRTCSQCTHVATRLSGSANCGAGSISARPARDVVHDCAPCADDPLGDALPKLGDELVGLPLAPNADPPALVFYTSKKACAAAR
jgi:hypothetical protein